MEFDYSKLRGKIRETYGTEMAFAEAMQMSRTTISMKLNGKYEWKTPQIVRACKLLEIPLEQSAQYFFAEKVKIS